MVGARPDQLLRRRAGRWRRSASRESAGGSSRCTKSGDPLEVARITDWEPGALVAWQSSLDDVRTEVRFSTAAGGGTLVRVIATIPDGGADRGGTAYTRRGAAVVRGVVRAPGWGTSLGDGAGPARRRRLLPQASERRAVARRGVRADADESAAVR